MKIFYFIVISLIGFTISSFAQNTAEKGKLCYNTVNSDDFNLLIQTSEVLLIDVRLSKEFRKERIKGACLASNKAMLQTILDKVGKDLNILVYCEEGDRSKTASEIICNDLKFNHVYNLEGGIIAWKERGYPIDNSHITTLFN